MRHPNISARSPTMMTMSPIMMSETTKQGQPPSSPEIDQSEASIINQSETRGYLEEESEQR